MATIDIRATVTCSLGGELISGSVSDDYIQGSGLVKTKGSCELVGLHTPAVGTKVKFSYRRSSTTKTIPRTLRVLSSFADPFRKTTKVELGCLLTYLSDLKEPEKTTGRQQQCLNGYAEYPADSLVPYPIRARDVMAKCLAKLGITANAIPLTNNFNIAEFDFGAGYVSILGDLLQSESYFGYLDESEQLQVASLTVQGGTGPQLTSEHVIDLGPIGVGDLPGEAVAVAYNSFQTDKEYDLAGSGREAWEEEEAYGDTVTIPVRADGFYQEYSYTPYTKVKTFYGQDNTWDPSTCVIASTTGEGLDQSNTVLRRETERRVLFAEAANAYCSQIITAGGTVDPSRTANAKTVEIYEYDKAGTLTRQTTERYEPFFAWAGGIDITFVYPNATGGSDYVTLGSELVLVERVIQTFETIYADVPDWMLILAGEGAKPAVEGQKTTTVTYQNWMLTPQGQQAAAEIQQSAPFPDDTDAVNWLNRIRFKLVQTDMQVRTSRRPADAAGQVRPAETRTRTPDSPARSVSKAELAFAVGSAAAQRVVTFTMPYQSDDIWGPGGQVIKSDAKEKALRYGRVQNQLLLGNRNGVNLQLAPSKMPKAPFTPLFLSDGKLSAMYRANAISWAFSSDGIVSSVDALYWGVAGGTGTPWVPVAPGVTTFPPLPVANASGEVTVPDMVPPWNELIKFLGVTKTQARITAFTPVSLGNTRINAATHTRLTAQEITKDGARIVFATRTIASVVDYAVGDLILGDTLPVLGASPVTGPVPSGWSLIHDSLLATSGVRVDFPFNFEFAGFTWANVFVNACGYLTFGTSAPTTTTGFGAGTPASHKILINPRTSSLKRIYTKIGKYTVQIRVEGAVDAAGTGAAYVYEVTFYSAATPAFGGGTSGAFDVRAGATPIIEPGGLLGTYNTTAKICAASLVYGANLSWAFFDLNTTGTTWNAFPNMAFQPPL